MMTVNKKRSILIVALAIGLCCLMVTAQPTQAFLPLLVFGIALLAGYITAYFADQAFSPPPPGVTADSHLSLFYNSKNNEFMSNTVGIMDEASAINGTGYFFGRGAEYSAMNFLANTTYPQWQILSYSGVGQNESVITQLGQIFGAWLSNYDSAISDTVRYAQASFTGSLSGLDLAMHNVITSSTPSVKAATNDFKIVYGSSGSTSISSGQTLVFNMGDIISNNSDVVLVYWTTYGSQDQIYLNVTDLMTGVNTQPHFNLHTSAHFENITLPIGVYHIDFVVVEQSYTDTLHYYLETDGCLINAASAPTNTLIWSQAANALYDRIDFIDTHANTYSVDLANTTQCNVLALQYSVDATQNFANSLANTYWTVLRNAGYTDISQIPPNQVIPPPDISFISNADLSLLTPTEIMAMYLAYLHALANFYNSTTYTNIVNFNAANVTFANEAVIVNASFMNQYQNVTYTEGDLYIQVYADMNLTTGLVLLNSTGLLYNLNDSSCWRYDSGDYLNISHIYVRDSITGTYQEVNYTTITATTIEGYVYTSNSGPPAVPLGGGGGGSGSGLLLLAIGVLVVIALLGSRGSSRGSSGTIVLRG